MHSLFFNPPTTTEIYPLSLHDALPISPSTRSRECKAQQTSVSLFRPVEVRWTSDLYAMKSEGQAGRFQATPNQCAHIAPRSEEHTSELQSLAYLVCRLLLEKKKTQYIA